MYSGSPDVPVFDGKTPAVMSRQYNYMTNQGISKKYSSRNKFLIDKFIIL